MEATKMEKFFANVDELEPRFIKRLRDGVRIPSISAYASHREDVFSMASFIMKEMHQLKIEAHLKPLGKEASTGIDLPPLVIGRYGREPSKPTILVYSHYDVQPAAFDDGWTHDPWELIEVEDGRLLGRGTSDDKGPLLGWLNMIEAFQESGLELPVNLVFCFEGMEENGSVGFRKALEEEAQNAFSNVDAICITDTTWTGNHHPSITRGLRGVLFYVMTIAGAEKDAHSGTFGGHISEPMTDMVKIMASLVDSQGRILIPGFYDDVTTLSADERADLENLHISVEDLAPGAGGRSLHENTADILIARWRMPSLSLHRIENAVPGAGAVTSIVSKVVGKFSVRTVADMKAEKLDGIIRQHVLGQFSRLNSRNDLEINCVHRSEWFLEDQDHWNYEAGKRAVKMVWDLDPDITYEGGSIPIALDLKQVLNKNVLLLPMGRSSDGAHSINEKLDKANFLNGIKTFGAYIDQIGQLFRHRA